MAKGLSAAALSAMASRAAHDEDSLDREGNEDGLAEQVIVSLVRCLTDAGPAAVHLLQKLCGAFDDMSEAVMRKDHAGLEDAADDAHQVLSKLLES